MHVFDARVEIFDIFADDHDVELASSEWRGDSGQLTHRTKICESLEQRSQRHIRRFIAVSDRSFEWTFENDFVLLDRFNCLGRDSGIDSFCEYGGSCFSNFGLDLYARCLYYIERGRGYFRPDAVAGNGREFPI